MYRVRSGDTLSSIAERYDISYQSIASYNDLNNASRIYTGQVLEIPLGGKKIRRRETNTFSKKRGNSADVRRVKQIIRQVSWPIPHRKFRLSSKFGWRWLKFHEGIDLAAPKGQTFYAAHAGKVILSGYHLSGYGKMIVVKSGAGLITVYAHNSTNYVSRGDYVEAGEPIGRVGSTGKSTGPHLHFEVRVLNSRNKYSAVDPFLFLPS